METKFTKGKWYIESESDNNIWICTDISVEAIAMVCSGYNDDTKKYEPEEKDIANAKLIAAAPEMFKDEIKNIILLKQLLQILRSQHVNIISNEIEARILACENTIKKATK